MPDLYLEPYDGPSADEFLDPDRPYPRKILDYSTPAELFQEELKNLLE